MRKGKLLECTLRIVQESLKDKDDTEIYSNHEIINSAGRRREFDIVIKSFINGFNLTVVMECKDYAGPVAVEKIEAFHSKCLRIPEINKKVFVSRRGFQADAIKAAEEFGIETYEVEDVEEELIKSWFSVSLIKPVTISVQLQKLRFWTHPPVSNPEFNLQSIIHFEGGAKSSTVINYIIGIIKQSGYFSNKVYFRKSGERINKTGIYSCEIDSLEGTFVLSLTSGKFDVIKIYFVFEVIEQEVHLSTKVERIKSDKKEMSTIITHETDCSESIKLVLKEGNPNKFDVFILNNDTGEIFDSGHTFEYEKKSE